MIKVQFQDQAQDLLYLYIDADGIIRYAGPFHAKLYVGCICTNRNVLAIGGKVEIAHNQLPRTFTWPIAAIDQLIPKSYDHVRRGTFKGFPVYEVADEIGILLAHDVPGRRAADLWRTGEIILCKKSFFKTPKAAV